MTNSRLIEELLALYGYPSRRREVRDLASRLPEMSRLAQSAGFSEPGPREIERFLVAGAGAVRPRLLVDPILALWGLPPYAALSTAARREQQAADAWRRSYERSTDEERGAEGSPVSANTLRHERHRRYFAAALADGLEAVVANRAQQLTPTHTTQQGESARRRGPVARTVEIVQEALLDDRGIRISTRYSRTSQAVTRTTGVRRVLITDSWDGVRLEVHPLSGCNLLAEETLVNNLRRVVLQERPSLPGEQHHSSYEVRMPEGYGSTLMPPDGGQVFSDEASDDFVSRIVVIFGARKPSIAWWFDDLPRPLVPSEPTPSHVIGLDPEGRLVRNFFPPTNARKCYGVAWRFSSSEPKSTRA